MRFDYWYSCCVNYCFYVNLIFKCVKVFAIAYITDLTTSDFRLKKLDEVKSSTCLCLASNYVVNVKAVTPIIETK